MKRVLLASIVSAGIALAATSAVSAYTFLGQSWRFMPVNHALDQNAVGAAQGGPGLAVAEAGLAAALAHWRSAGSDWVGVVAPNLSSHSSGNWINEISWTRNWDPAQGDPNQVLAVSNVLRAATTTLAADIVFNGDTYDWATGVPVRRDGTSISATSVVDVMTHEIGHTLGLGHSTSATAVMNAGASNQAGALNSDDVAGILALYPPGAPLCGTDAFCPGIYDPPLLCNDAGFCEAAVLGQLGASCEDVPCNGDLVCRGLLNGRTCTMQCFAENECSNGFSCVGEGYGVYYCMTSGPAAVGEACMLNADCQSDICNSGSCRASCTDDCDCPTENYCRTITAATIPYSYCRSGVNTCSRCGDGITGFGEECDDGVSNSDVLPDGCRTTCLAASCGDGVRDSTEACDNGASNSNSLPNGCRTNCVAASCGDYVRDSGEECDNGAGNSDTLPSRCRTNCLAARCGDGTLDFGEACDDGADNSDSLPNRCRTTCVRSSCGDGVRDSTEECDDNNTVNGDGCSAYCRQEAPPAPDAGTPQPDAATPLPDAATPLPDAATPQPDAATPLPDAATEPQPDAATTTEPQPDAATTTEPQPDAATTGTGTDAGISGTGTVGGGCQTGGGTGGWATLLLGLVFTMSRRKREGSKRESL